MGHFSGALLPRGQNVPVGQMLPVVLSVGSALVALSVQ